MRQPTHDDFSPPDHLLAIDAQVLALPRLGPALRSAGDDQAPGDQRSDIAGPAGLDRPAATGRSRRPRRARRGRGRSSAWWVSCSTAPWPFPRAGPASARRRGGSGSRSAASNAPNWRRPSAPPTPIPRATRLGVPNRLARTFASKPVGFSNKQRRTLPPQRNVGNCRHFELRRDRFVDSKQLASLFQAGQKVAQVSVVHIFVI